MAVEITITGGWADGFTAAELARDGRILGRVFELQTGWHVQLEELELLRDTAVVSAMLEGRDKLRHYVNRTGAGMPEGLSAAAASMWLMQRDDGKGFFDHPAFRRESGRND